jgi:hypothetical protein
MNEDALTQWGLLGKINKKLFIMEDNDQSGKPIIWW